MFNVGTRVKLVLRYAREVSGTIVRIDGDRCVVVEDGSTAKIITHVSGLEVV